LDKCKLNYIIVRPKATGWLNLPHSASCNAILPPLTAKMHGALTFLWCSRCLYYLFSILS